MVVLLKSPKEISKVLDEFKAKMSTNKFEQLLITVNMVCVTLSHNKGVNKVALVEMLE